MTNEEALGWFKRRKESITLGDKCQQAEDIAITAIEALIDKPAKPPRLLPLEVVLSTSGSGWLESIFGADPDDGETEPQKFLLECAWCYGNVVTGDGDVTTDDCLERWYNKADDGMRVWSAKPTKELQEATAWE